MRVIPFFPTGVFNGVTMNTWIRSIHNPTLSHETLHVHTHAQAWRGVLDPTSKEDRYSARIYIERSYRDLGNRRSEYNYILHYLEQSRKEPKCTKVRFPRVRVRTCTQRAPTRTQVLVPVQAFRSNSGIRTVLRTRLQVAKY